jgi:hypothetical protein
MPMTTDATLAAFPAPSGAKRAGSSMSATA